MDYGKMKKDLSFQEKTNLGKIKGPDIRLNQIRLMIINLSKIQFILSCKSIIYWQGFKNHHITIFHSENFSSLGLLK